MLSPGLLFLCAGAIEHIVWSREIEDMEGLAAKAPMVTTITAIGMLSMFLPPFGMLAWQVVGHRVRFNDSSWPQCCL